MVKKKKPNPNNPDNGKTESSKLKKYTELTIEMVQFCYLVRDGKTEEEIRKELEIEQSKIDSFLKNTIIQQRIIDLMGDKYEYWIKLRDNIYENALLDLNAKIVKGDLKPEQLINLMKDYESSSRVDQTSPDKKGSTKEEKTLLRDDSVLTKISGAKGFFEETKE